MELLDSRRLTGPNLVWSEPGALLEVRFSDENEPVVAAWKNHIRLLRNKLGLPDLGLKVKRTHIGAWLVVGGPIDQLYGLIDLSELAWNRAVEDCGGWKPEKLSVENEEVDFMSTVDSESSVLTEESIAESLKTESNPALIALQSEAAARQVPFLWDDDFVSLGMGIHSQTWPVQEIPLLESIPWARFSSIPIAVVTGTNGKSTNVRLLSFMASLEDLCIGSTSTDWIRVADEVIDTGDYSGPGGARMVLRHPKVEMAVLETARGGLLRRGVGITKAAVALITNVAEDHMGQYGIDSVEQLAEAKMIVSQVVRHDGILILNADDPVLAKIGSQLDGQRLGWFSTEPHNLLVNNHLLLGGSACFLESGMLVYQEGTHRVLEIPVADVPLTLGGKAVYNVANCLSAMAVGFALKLSKTSIQNGLLQFQSTPETNPGRSNYFQAGSQTILLDYAHNVHGLKAILDTTAKLSSGRRIITLSTAGDRTEREIRQLAFEAVQAGVEVILLADCVGYERELGKGGVPRIMADEIGRLGRTAEVFESELEAAAAALKLAESGDMVILLVKSQRQETLDLIYHQQQKQNHVSS